MDNCKYELIFPNDGIVHCDAYSQSKRPDGYYWAHYPYCKDENCPLKHPDLLEGAILQD